MIITHTSNPSIDLYVKLKDALRPGVQRSFGSNLLAGGKGLNVSMVLDHLGIDSIATAYIGGFTGSYLIKQIETHAHITLDAVSIEGMNRINIKIRGQEEVDINDSGPNITDAEKDKMLERLAKVKEDDYLVISGSLAKGITEEFLLEVGKIAEKNRAKLVLDVACVSRDVVTACKPALIKPNIEELASLFPDDELPQEEMIRQLLDSGVKAILLSKGDRGAELYSNDHHYIVEHHAQKTINTVGAGDSMLATYIGMLSKTGDVPLALKWAGAAGCAAAISEGLPTLDKVESLIDDIVVRKV